MAGIYPNYTQESHLLIGDFKEQYKDFRINVLRKTGWIHYQPRLKVGKGWVFKKEKESELISLLNSNRISYKWNTSLPRSLRDEWGHMYQCGLSPYLTEFFCISQLKMMKPGDGNSKEYGVGIDKYCGIPIIFTRYADWFNSFYYDVHNQHHFNHAKCTWLAKDDTIVGEQINVGSGSDVIVILIGDSRRLRLRLRNVPTGVNKGNGIVFTDKISNGTSFIVNGGMINKLKLDVLSGKGDSIFIVLTQRIRKG